MLFPVQHVVDWFSIFAVAWLTSYHTIYLYMFVTTIIHTHRSY
jgi:hypothetical protein